MADNTETINIYCERLDSSFWSEPLNAITNLSFFIAAFLLYRLYKSHPIKSGHSLVLIGLIALIGTGSFLFHTMATRTTMLMDVIPIMIFVLYYLWLLLRQFLQLTPLMALICLGAFYGFAMLMSNVPDAYRFNGSIAYFPCFAALITIGVILAKRNHPAAFILFKAIGIFAVSLTFRSIDMIVCESFPIGTHILWHILNGVVLYLLTKAMILYNVPLRK